MERTNGWVEKYRNHGRETPNLDMRGTNTYCRIVDVIDGDTLEAVLMLPDSGSFYRFRMRLHGINAPEIHDRDAENRNNALRAKERLSRLVSPDGTGEDLCAGVHIAYVRCMGRDKYGRVLGRFFPDDRCEPETEYSVVLVNEGFAHPYDGKGPR